MLAIDDAPPQAAPAADMPERVRALCRAELAPLAEAIDAGFYPAATIRRLGALGAYRAHLPDASGRLDLAAAIEAASAVSETCMATGFVHWCQATLAWYLGNSDNARLRDRLLEEVASGRRLGGTGLSNPMKSFFGIERLKLEGRRVPGGYVVRGALPWVSNLGPDHAFGTVFAVADEPARRVMFLAECDAPGVSLHPCEPFLAMDGTATYAVRFRDVFVPDANVLADPCAAYVERIRAGFVLLQTGMGIGLMRDCLAIMREVRPALGHVNRYLTDQPEDLAEALAAIEARVARLARTPYDPSAAYFREVVEARLRCGEGALHFAQAALLHAGARGFVRKSRVQRRLREAAFFAIVTPATKQLRKMLADMDAQR